MFPIVVERGSSKHRTHMLVLGIIVLALLVLAAFILPEYQVGRVNRMWAMVIAIMGLNLVLGYGGLFALGHSAFIGLGAFMSGWLVQDMGLTIGWLFRSRWQPHLRLVHCLRYPLSELRACTWW